jgi:hypothetical protein
MLLLRCLRLLLRCKATVKVKAAVKVLRPPSRCTRLLSKCLGCYQGAVDIEAVMLLIAPELFTTYVNFGLCTEEKEPLSTSGLQRSY